VVGWHAPAGLAGAGPATAVASAFAVTSAFSLATAGRPRARSVRSLPVAARSTLRGRAAESAAGAAGGGSTVGGGGGGVVSCAFSRAIEDGDCGPGTEAGADGL
jgi:hypothetical protein